MGIGGAFIMPSTLSLITNVFPPEERGRAISYWAAIAGVGVALGPMSGGLLLEHFYWGSIFLVNLPIVAVALVAGVVPAAEVEGPVAPTARPRGRGCCRSSDCCRSSTRIIEGPTEGWTSATILGAFAIAVVVLALFALVGARSRATRCSTSTVFENPRFSAASVGIMLIFFAMFGATFLLTQYLQIIMGFSAAAGRRRAAAVGGDRCSSSRR